MTTNDTNLRRSFLTCYLMFVNLTDLRRDLLADEHHRRPKPLPIGGKSTDFTDSPRYQTATARDARIASQPTALNHMSAEAQRAKDDPLAQRVRLPRGDTVTLSTFNNQQSTRRPQADII